MKLIIQFLFCSFAVLYASEAFIKPPYKLESPKSDAQYFTNEGFRAASFGSRKIAKDLFYKACVLGDNLGCLALNEMKQDLSIESRIIAKDECDLGDKDACFKLYKYYLTETMQDNFKANWYLSKSCRLGKTEACTIELSTDYTFITNKRQILNKECFYNDVMSCYKLANIYLFGDGVAINIDFARNLFKKSCQNGLNIACREYIRITSFD